MARRSREIGVKENFYMRIKIGKIVTHGIARAQLVVHLPLGAICKWVVEGMGEL
jgi:hypothetical protein